MRQSMKHVMVVMILLLLAGACKKNESQNYGSMQLIKASAGSASLSSQQTARGVAINSKMMLQFSNPLDTNTVRANIILFAEGGGALSYSTDYGNNNATVIISPLALLNHGTVYILQVGTGIKGLAGESFAGTEYRFETVAGVLTIETVTVNGIPFQLPLHPQNIDWKNADIRVSFSDPIDTSFLNLRFFLSPNAPVSIRVSNSNRTVDITNNASLNDYSRYYFHISNELMSDSGYTFAGFDNFFYTMLDSIPKFPLVPDEELLTIIQQQTFRYFYDFAHPACGLARERNNSGDIVTIGGSGFGVMALIVGMERGFITRAQGTDRLALILSFLETCDRFHGAWPHWLNGSTGKVVPFSPNDDGADLVETSYMVEGLFTIRQYLDPADPAESALINRINALLDGVEYDWFTRGQNVLYWHWSPDAGWAMNMQIKGYNECLITYIAAATSMTHPITAEVYHQGYASNGGIVNGNSYYGYVLPLGEPYGGPLFFTHYTYLGLDPRNLKDMYADYHIQNVNQSLINYSYCVDNPKQYVSYSTSCWGLTACDNPWGYSAHSPTNDLGVIAPTAAVSALPYTPEQSLAAIRFFYYQLGDRLWGDYGFYDSFDVTAGWYADSFLAIDEGPIICMIENYRSALLWNLFMSCPEVQAGLTKLGFTY